MPPSAGCATRSPTARPVRLRPGDLTFTQPLGTSLGIARRPNPSARAARVWSTVRARQDRSFRWNSGVSVDHRRAIAADEAQKSRVRDAGLSLRRAKREHAMRGAARSQALGEGELSVGELGAPRFCCPRAVGSSAGSSRCDGSPSNCASRAVASPHLTPRTGVGRLAAAVGGARSCPQAKHGAPGGASSPALRVLRES
jgi:hypothetical protein